jgi:hypothetical protein
MSNYLTLLEGIDGDIYSHSFVLDSINNMYTTGYTTAKVIKIGDKKYSRNSPNDDGYVLKINKNGEVEWFHWIDGSNSLATFSIGVDSLNNIVLTGFSNSKTVIINNISYSKTNETNDGFAIKINQNGNVMWFKWIEGAKSDIGYKLAIDKNDEIVIVGMSNSPALNNVNKPTFTNPAPTKHSNGGFLIKMNTGGDVLWFKWIEGSKYDDAFSVILDNDNNIYVAGNSSSSTLKIDNQSYQKLNNNQSIYIATFTPAGGIVSCIWIAGEGMDTITNIKCDKYNFLYIAGISNSKNIIFNQILYERLNAAEIFTPFVVKFNSNNLHETVWFKWFENDKDTHIYALTTDNINNVYIGGTTGSSYMYVNDLELANVNKNTNAFLLKLDSNGELEWNTWISNKHNNDKSTFITNLLVDNNYNIYVNAYSNGNELYFNKEYLFSNNNTYDNAFVIKYNLNDITLENSEKSQINVIIDNGGFFYRYFFFLVILVLYIYGIWTLYKKGLI